MLLTLSFSNDAISAYVTIELVDLSTIERLEDVKKKTQLDDGSSLCEPSPPSLCPPPPPVELHLWPPRVRITHREFCHRKNDLTEGWGGPKTFPLFFFGGGG